jgi:hypothetical protein
VPARGAVRASVARFLLMEALRNATYDRPIGGNMHFDPRTTIAVQAKLKEPPAPHVPAKAPRHEGVSPLFAKLICAVDQERLVLDSCYFKLVSEIAELLDDDEIALLALYLMPRLTLGLPSKTHRLALSIMRERRKEMGHA